MARVNKDHIDTFIIIGKIKRPGVRQQLSDFLLLQLPQKQLAGLFPLDILYFIFVDILIGLHEPGKFDRVFELARCHIQSDRANEVVTATREFVVANGLSVYGLKSHRGLLRFLVVREGIETDDLMVVLVTGDEPFPQAADYAAALVRAVPSITTVLHSVSRSRAGVATGGEYTVLHGDGRIHDRIGPFTFGISPDAFFQTNTRQAERLYECIRDFCGLTGSERLLDLYCGTGTIGIFCAGDAAHVTGVELVEDAVADACANATLNGIENIEFIAAHVEAVVGENMAEEPFDVAICDPPRAGIHPDGLAALCRMRIPRLVYVSCNVKQLPLDLEALTLAGYRITAVRAFDMSPHTPHIETVVRLDLG